MLVFLPRKSEGRGGRFEIRKLNPPRTRRSSERSSKPVFLPSIEWSSQQPSRRGSYPCIDDERDHWLERLQCGCRAEGGDQNNVQRDEEKRDQPSFLGSLKNMYVSHLDGRRNASRLSISSLGPRRLEKESEARKSAMVFDRPLTQIGSPRNSHSSKLRSQDCRRSQRSFGRTLCSHRGWAKSQSKGCLCVKTEELISERQDDVQYVGERRRTELTGGRSRRSKLQG